LEGDLACFIAAGEKEVLGELRVLRVLKVPGFYLRTQNIQHEGINNHGSPEGRKFVSHTRTLTITEQ